MMQQTQPKSAATRGDATTRPFVELAYSQGWNTALYQLGGRHASPRLLTCRSQRGGGHWAVCQLSGTVVWTR